jgi:IstB-like ATP binding protein
VRVRYQDGTEQVAHFLASRLKYSRWAEVTLVPDRQVEGGNERGAATLIDELSAAFRDGQLAQALQAYTHPAVLVVDEVGYLTYGTDAANMLFHVVNERHRRHRSMIFTTNKALTAWGRVLHDEISAGDHRSRP